MKFTLTPTGAKSLTSAFKDVVMLPAQLAAIQATSDATKYNNLFRAQTYVARQNYLNSGTNLNDQKYNIRNTALSPALDIDRFNRLSVLTGGKAYTPFQQDKKVIGGSFNTATGDFNYSTPVAQAVVANRVAANLGASPDGQPLTAQQVNLLNLGYSGKPFDQYKSVGQTGRSLDVLSGQQGIGDKSLAALFDALQNARTNNQNSSAVAHRAAAQSSLASAAAARALANQRNVLTRYMQDNGVRMPTAGGGSRSGGTATPFGKALSPSQFGSLFKHTDDLGVTRTDEAAMGEAFSAISGRGLPVTLTTVMAYKTGGTSALDALKGSAPAQSSVPAATGSPGMFDGVADIATGASAPAASPAAPEFALPNSAANYVTGRPSTRTESAIGNQLKSAGIPAAVRANIPSGLESGEVETLKSPSFKQFSQAMAHNYKFMSMPPAERQRVIKAGIRALNGDYSARQALMKEFSTRAKK